MDSFIKLCKKEAVAIIIFTASVISCFFVPVTNYVAYIDTDLIGVLFGLMAVVAGFAENNVLKVLSEFTVSHAGNTRRLAFTLVMTVFFISMLITNDVALIAFIPFTLMLYEKIGKSPVYVVVLQTIAANMGSAFTPVGNPQNLYLFSVSGMTTTEFFGITIHVTAISLVMLAAAALFIKKEPLELDTSMQKAQITNPKYIALYAVLFILCLLAVFDVIQTIYVFASVCVVLAIIQPKLFACVDYGLLATFACFFVFVGNVKNIPQVTEFMNGIIGGREFESALIASQVISNVPAAIMLSAFTDNFKALILGTDIGGLGTIIASLASLISYKHYCGSNNAEPRKFMLVFTIVNVIFLAALYIYAKAVIL